MMMRNIRFRAKKYLNIIFLILVLTSCSDEKIEITQLEHCLNHFQAESFLVAKQECETAANNGQVNAQWLMADIERYDLLKTGKKNLEQAFKWYIKAAEQKHIASMREVGLAYLYASGVNESFDDAHIWLMKAAKKHDSRAEFAVGILFFEAKGRKKDIGSAVNWFKRAASQNHTMSINNLSWIFATSKQSAFRNSKKAQYWIDKLDKRFIDVPMFLDTKAAVYAVHDDFEQAVELQNKAIANLPTETSEEELLEYQKHLDSYLKGEAWFE